MRGLSVGIVGALAIAAAAFGLALDGFRAGPFDRALEPAVVAAEAEGTYHSTPGSAGPLGLCVEQPCEAGTVLDLRVRGLPPVPYEVRLQGPTSAEAIGTFEPVAGSIQVRWSQARDHSDKDRLVLAVAGRDVGALAVSSSAAPLDLSGPLPLAWGAQPASLHVNEIGGVVISSTATTRLAEAPPPGWEFRARFEGPSGPVDFGALEPDDGGSVLDGRVERLRLEDHESAVLVVAPLGSAAGAGFPVLRADLWPSGP